MKKKWTEKLKKVSAVLAAAVLAASVCAPATAVFADGGTGTQEDPMQVPIDMKESVKGGAYGDGPSTVAVGDTVAYQATIDMSKLAAIAEASLDTKVYLKGNFTMTVRGTVGLKLDPAPISATFTDYFSGESAELFDLTGAPSYKDDTLTLNAKVKDIYSTDGISGSALATKISKILTATSPSDSTVTVTSDIATPEYARAFGTFEGNISYSPVQGLPDAYTKTIYMTGTQQSGEGDTTLETYGKDDSASVSTTVLNNPTDATASITKKLDVPAGTTVPNASFEMVFTPKSADEASISSVYIPFTSGMTVDSTGSVSAKASITFPKYTAAGVYEYTVSETPNTYTNIAGDQMTYDSSTYEMKVYVANKPGSSNETYIKVIEFSTDSFKTKSSTEPTFENKYVKPASFTISKKVSGEFADKTKEFNYSLTLTQGSVTLGTTSVNATIYNGNTSTGKTVSFKFGTANQFTLKDGQSLKFENNLPAGTTYTLTETGATGYTASAVITENGAAPTSVSGTEGNGLDSGKTYLIGEGTNSVAFTNTYKDVTPTGISINNSPFVALILISAAALAAFIFLKKFRMHLEK